MWQWLDAVLGLKPEFTRGEAVGIAATVILALGAVFWTTLKAYLIRHPLKMRFSDEPYDADPKSVDIGRIEGPTAALTLGVWGSQVRILPSRPIKPRV